MIFVQSMIGTLIVWWLKREHQALNLFLKMLFWLNVCSFSNIFSNDNEHFRTMMTRNWTEDESRWGKILLWWMMKFRNKREGECDDAWWDSLRVKKVEMWWRSCTMGQKWLNSVRLFSWTFAPLSFVKYSFPHCCCLVPQSTTLAHLFVCFY